MSRTQPSESSPKRRDERAAAIARLYRERAPRAPDRGFDLVEIFSSTAQIELEIGFGRGLFLIQRAAAAPSSQLLGLEIKQKLTYLVAQRCQRLGLSQVQVMAGDARAVLPGVTPNASLARAFIHFPDPWWKKRHAKRRLLGEDILDQLARLLRPGGELFIQTDVEERMQEGLRQLLAHPAFVLSDGGLLDHNPFGAVSNREQRAIADGVPIYRILAKRA